MKPKSTKTNSKNLAKTNSKNLVLLSPIPHCQNCGREIKPNQGVWVLRMENGIVIFSGHLCIKCWKSGK